MWIRIFIDYLRFERNLSEKTVEAYQTDLKEFEQFYKNLDEEFSWQTNIRVWTFVRGRVDAVLLCDIKQRTSAWVWV